MGATAAAIIIRKEKQLVAHFQQAQATTPAMAQTMAALGIDEGTALRRLRTRAVIREGAPGSLYLDEPSWQALRKTRLRMVIVMLVIVIALAIAAFLSSRT
jgi:hypothetical protein